MIRFFDVLFIRTYKQYIKWKEKDVPGLYGLMVISLFQAFNILFFIVIIIGSSKGRNWSVSKAELTILSLIILAINAFRIYKIIGIKNLFTRYENNLHLIIHPIVYFVISLGALAVLRIINIFPHIV